MNYLNMTSIETYNSALNSKSVVLHFIGIGGIGMSAIAEGFHKLGYRVQGSDISNNYITDRLKKSGIDVKIGHNASNIDNCNLVIKSTAICKENPEYLAAKSLALPVLERAQGLAYLMEIHKTNIAISGTHGKTTTTALTARLFEEAMLKPTVINGGIINEYGSNLSWGDPSYCIAEADESDGSFLLLPRDISIVTNLDHEHTNFYPTFDDAKYAYLKFLNGTKQLSIVCNDNSDLLEVVRAVKSTSEVITYGIEQQSDLRATDIILEPDHSLFNIVISEKAQYLFKLNDSVIKNIRINSAAGIHNVSNALAAITAALYKKIAVDFILSGFAKFQGVKRRFTKIAEVNNILIVDDYAHHPQEIKATIAVAKKLADSRGGKVLAVFQPHRYTRFNDLFEEFCNSFEFADIVFAIPIYSAGEAISSRKKVSENLITRLTELNKPSFYLENLEILPQLLNKLAQTGDIVIMLGAGDISNFSYTLPEKLLYLSKG